MSVYKKISDNVKTFESESEFLKYYEKNKESIDETKTKSLNLKYKINGYKIGRKEGKIILYPTKKNIDSESEEKQNINETIKEIREDIEKLKLAYQQLFEIMNQPKVEQKYPSNRYQQ